MADKDEMAHYDDPGRRLGIAEGYLVFLLGFRVIWK